MLAHFFVKGWLNYKTMLISLPEIVQKYNLNIKGVIQVGAHWAEEHDIYVELGIKNIIYIEPCKAAYNKILEKIFAGIVSRNNSPYAKLHEIYDSEGNRATVFNYACGETAGKFIMNVAHANQGQSNSLLSPHLHLNQHPEVVFNDTEEVDVITLDSLNLFKDKAPFNMLMMDVQGAEGLVLKGATETLKQIDIIYTECNRDQTYEGNMLIEEMDAFLKPFGFFRVETFWPSPNWSWGDCVYLKPQFSEEPILAREIEINRDRIFLSGV